MLTEEKPMGNPVVSEKKSRHARQIDHCWIPAWIPKRQFNLVPGAALRDTLTKPHMS